MKKLFLLIGACAMAVNAFAWEAGLGLYKEIDDVQDSDGEEVSLPFNPMLMIGHTFNLTPSWVFSPYLGYVKHRDVSDDDYGEYDVTTIKLIYDFLWNPGMSAAAGYSLRYGLGTFIRKYEGDGGSVTVPNGSSGTDTAYRPGKRDSATLSYNFGAEAYLDSVGNIFKASGVRGELFMFHPLSGEKRMFSFNLMWLGYF